MRRRSFLAATAATLALPASLRAQPKTTLRFVPEQDLATLDPHISTVYVTRNHGYMVFDTLFGQDASFNYTPQMLAGSVTGNDGKLWTLTLRDGLVFHDGTPVLARDCVASINRWGKRAALGDALLAATDELSAPDDKTITVNSG
jgi:peptide/nickel transport system substrate-binding protein